MEETTTTRIYKEDKELLEDFMKLKKIKSWADAVRICIQFANAHGGLQ